MKTKLIWIRGAIGDLLILLPIAISYAAGKPYHLIYTGPLQLQQLNNLFSLLDFHKPVKLLVLKNDGCILTDETLKNAEWVCDREPDLILNHASGDRYKPTIARADDIHPEIDRDYLSLKIHSESLAGQLSKFPFRRKQYVVFCPYGNSNPRWQSKECKAAFAAIAKHITAKGIPIVVLGKCQPHLSNEYSGNALGLALEKFNVINYTNMTSLKEAVGIMANSIVNVCFDSGMKNLAYLMPNAAITLHDPSWHSANPIEAWTPQQILSSPHNSLWDIESFLSNTTTGLKEIDAIFERAGIWR